MLKIDGYTPPDAEIALEQGVNFEYSLPFGEIYITAKMAGKENFGYRNAITQYEQWAQRRRSLGGRKQDEEADRRFLGIWYDHLVLEWSTTITSDGKPIAPTRESFVELFMSPALEKAAAAFLQDASDETNFRPKTADELQDFSEASSVGATSGRRKKGGSDESDQTLQPS